jgi:hypothetical protein
MRIILAAMAGLFLIVVALAPLSGCGDSGSSSDIADMIKSSKNKKSDRR